MAGTEGHEQQTSWSAVNHRELLRALTVERFTLWKPAIPAAYPGTRLDPQGTEAVRGDTADVPSVRGRVHDGKTNREPRRVR